MKGDADAWEMRNTVTHGCTHQEECKHLANGTEHGLQMRWKSATGWRDSGAPKKIILALSGNPKLQCDGHAFNIFRIRAHTHVQSGLT